MNKELLELFPPSMQAIYAPDGVQEVDMNKSKREKVVALLEQKLDEFVRRIKASREYSSSPLNGLKQVIDLELTATKQSLRGKE